MNRLRESRWWVVSFPILRPFGPRRGTAHDAVAAMASSRVVPRRGGLITVHELHQTIREIGQELSIDDVCFIRVLALRVR